MRKNFGLVFILSAISFFIAIPFAFSEEKQPREFTKAQSQEIEICLRERSFLDTAENQIQLTDSIRQVGGVDEAMLVSLEDTNKKNLEITKKREKERCAGISDEIIEEYQAWKAINQKKLMEEK